MITTKQQERAALEQIKKIVEGLGENSYIATAFNGVWTLAERNIDEDAAFSALDWAHAADNHYEICKQTDKQIAELERECKRLKEGWEDQRNINVELKKSNSELRFLNLEDGESIIKLNETITSLESIKAWQDVELVRLKAKLYDFMTTTYEK